MILTFPHGEDEISYTVPPTTADVLEWSVWVMCMDGQVEHALACALQWAAKWVVSHDVARLGEALGSLEDVVRLCNASAASAGVSRSLLDALAAHMDAENEVPATWRPKSSLCSCARCRRGIAVADQPCYYERDGFDPRILHAARHVSEAEDVSAPYYVTQIRAVMAAAESRRLGYRREQDEIKRKHDSMHAAIGGR